MGVQNIVDFVKVNMTMLPEWFMGVFWHIVGVLLIVYLLTAFFKALSSQAFIGPIRSTVSLLIRFLRSVFTGYASALESPIERPKTKLVAKAFGLLHTYTMCVVFFLFFCVLFVLLVLAGPTLDPLKQFGGLGVLVFLFSMALFFRSETDREWLSLKAQWHQVRSKSEADDGTLPSHESERSVALPTRPIGSVIQGNEKKFSVKKLSFLLIGGVILLVLFYAGALIYFTWPISKLSLNGSGAFGDSFGLLTSLFSGLAFAGLIITIIMQKDELALQRQELSLTREELNGQRLEMMEQNATLRIQRFENTFFKMLELLEACRNDIFYQGFQQSAVEGRDAVRRLYKLFTDHYLHNWHQDGMDQKKVFDERCKEIDGIREKYNKFYGQEYGEEIGQYYRTLYNILKLVDRSDFLDNKFLYTNLVRSQLSRYELSLLFYNCVSDYGKEKMAPLIRKYKVLKHLEENTLPAENIHILEEFTDLFQGPNFRSYQP